MEGVNSRKRLNLDLDALFHDNDGEPPQTELVKGDIQPPKPSLANIDQSTDDLPSMTDHQLQEKIKRYEAIDASLRLVLPDKGEKARNMLQNLKEERRRRDLARAQKDVDQFSNHIQLTTLNRMDGHEQEVAFSEVNSQSDFTSSFTRKIEENNGHSVDDAFDKELSVFGHRHQQIMRSSGATFQSIRKKPQLSSSRQSPFRSASSLSRNGGKHGSSNCNLKGKLSSTDEILSSNLMKKKDNCQALRSKNPRLRQEQTIVLVDEDDTQFIKTERENRIAEYMKDTKIYYPSRDDLESVEICYSNINCLEPEGFLTSEIMNFYIRYLRLQMSPTHKALCDYHFFTTYFYKKLKQAVSHKVCDKESSFVKFRRWWKGDNIFQKAYVFIPIHEDLHWSLVIISIPDKEDRSGPVILHLDSLGFHSSKLVFEEIKSFLKQEWHYLKDTVSPVDLPVAEHIWENLPRRIDEQIIEVPQQKNDYDCGLFVLFFMERFIEVAPERLKKKDLAMFGKQWFRPEEASGLRVKIRNLLLDAFEKASISKCNSKSLSSSSDGIPP